MSDEMSEAEAAGEDVPTCVECDGRMAPIRILDRNYRTVESLNYTLPGAKQSFWTGRFPEAGVVEAMMCADCGRITLFGRPG